MKSNPGKCPVCRQNTTFIEKGPWLRDQYVCAKYGAIPRERALMHIIGLLYPRYRDLEIHESSPGNAASACLQRECVPYTCSHFFPGIPTGAHYRGVRCENLERLTFGNDSFDLFVTQDVFEHVLNPEKAFREVARVLRPGGAHIFTVPYKSNRTTEKRAIETASGIEHVKPEMYHSNPIDPQGSLVVTDWGDDIAEIIKANSGLETTIYFMKDRYFGIDGEYLEVFASRKLVTSPPFPTASPESSPIRQMFGL